MKKLIPIIESVDENAVRGDAETIYRDCIMLVVKHPGEEKYLYISNKKFGWNFLVQGGIEEGENMLVSAIRELVEETGFTDIKSVKKLDFIMDNVYYAAHKKQNRYAVVYTFYIELNSLTQKEHEDVGKIKFDTYKNLKDIFGAAFVHHYYLLGIATGNQKEEVSVDKTRLGENKLVNHMVKYREE